MDAKLSTMEAFSFLAWLAGEVKRLLVRCVEVLFHQSVTLDIRFSRFIFRYRLASRARVVTAHSGSYRLPALLRTPHGLGSSLNRIVSFFLCCWWKSVYQSLTMVC
jgi:hypothetical protein